MKHYIKPTALAVLLMMAACTTDELGGEDQTGTHDPDAPIEFPVTRTTDGGEEEEATVFVEDTEIGVYMDGYEEYSNQKYVYQGGTFVPASARERILYREVADKDVTFTAYYPYDSSGNYDDLSVSNMQNTEYNYYISDDLVGTAKPGEPLRFTHRMAKVIVKIPEPMGNVYLLDMPNSSSNTRRYNIGLLEGEDELTWRGFFLPGTYDIKIRLVSGATKYVAYLGSRTLEAGKQYTFTVDELVGGDAHPLDISKGSVNITVPGQYRIIQSEGTYTENSIRVDVPGGTVNLRLDDLYVWSKTVALEIVHGSVTIWLEKSGNVLTSMQPGQPAISLVNPDAHVKVYKDPNSSEERPTLELYGGPQDGFFPGGPAIGVACDKTGGTIEISDCTLDAKAVGAYSAVIGTCGGCPGYSWETRTSACGNIKIQRSTLKLWNSYLGGDYIGNGVDLTRAPYGTQYLKCGNIELYGCTLDPADMKIGTYNASKGERYTCGTVKISN